MPLINIIECDECGKRISIDQETPGAEFIIEHTDAKGEKIFHCGEGCMKIWAAKYTSPYKRPEPAEFIPLDAILPGTREN